ncbi:MAG: PLP-dependent aminotransferase family protein [Planctomycetota bacterium]
MVSIWKPSLIPGRAPLYLALADALANDIATGALRPGEQLPTHRALARALGLNIGTISRAYAEAESRGLINGEVGRGSFIRHATAQPSFDRSDAVAPAQVHDLAINVPAGGPTAEERSSALRALADRPDLADCFETYRPAGLDRHREAGVRWLERSGVAPAVERVLITGGAQHAMAVALAALSNAGDGVMAESLTYPGLKSLASLLRLRTHAVAMDEHGILPDALEAVAKKTRARFVYLMPNLHNPTGVILPEDRRRAIAGIAERHGLWIVEDDSHGFLLPKDGAIAPVAAFAPERTLFIESLSKSVSAGLRVAYLLAPCSDPDLMPRLIGANNAIAWMGAPLMCELAALWIGDGTAARIARAKRSEIAARQMLARRLLDDPKTPSAPTSSTLWLELPDPWRADEFVKSCRKRGVAVSAPESFAVLRSNVPHAVRLCIGTPSTREELSEALTIVSEVLRVGPSMGSALV